MFHGPSALICFCPTALFIIKVPDGFLRFFKMLLKMNNSDPKVNCILTTITFDLIPCHRTKVSYGPTDEVVCQTRSMLSPTPIPNVPGSKGEIARE